MQNTFGSLALIALIFTSNLSLLAQRSEPEEGLIRRAFLMYKEAILQQQGPSALSLVNRATVQYYARMRTLALEGQEKEVRQLTPMNKIMVLSLRHRVPIGDLRAMTPEEVFTEYADKDKRS